VIDGNGNIIWPDRLMILLAQDILSRNPGSSIIFDVKCSTHLKKAIAAAGGRPVMAKTGHSLIKAKMKETGALLAGEMSGHIFFKERWYGFDDGLYTAVRLLELLANDSRTPNEVFGALPNSINTPELNVAFAEGEHYRFIEAFRKNARFKGAEITDIDGLRADFSDGWGLVRASNTTPNLVLRFEANNAAELKRIQDLFREQMLKVDAKLRLPF
jgi:phosphomannomutase/phosphoglucomutase